MMSAIFLSFSLFSPPIHESLQDFLLLSPRDSVSRLNTLIVNWTGMKLKSTYAHDAYKLHAETGKEDLFASGVGVELS